MVIKGVGLDNDKKLLWVHVIKDWILLNDKCVGVVTEIKKLLRDTVPGNNQVNEKIQKRCSYVLQLYDGFIDSTDWKGANWDKSGDFKAMIKECRGQAYELWKQSGEIKKSPNNRYNIIAALQICQNIFRVANSTNGILTQFEDVKESMRQAMVELNKKSLKITAA